jgi:multicomponent Na+:H+ antiporter subunit B
MRLDLILRVATKLILPFMLLFALYVQFHGDYGAGGGFQAGTIAGAGVILIYASVGVAGWLTGGNYLEYNHFAHDPVHGQEWGVFLVEAGVFVTVSSTMVAIFYAFTGRGRSR